MDESVQFLHWDVLCVAGLLAIEVPEALIDKGPRLLRNAKLLALLLEKLENLITEECGVAEDASEALIIGLLHHSHFVKLQWLVQSVQKLLNSLTHLQGELLSAHLLVNVQ